MSPRRQDFRFAVVYGRNARRALLDGDIGFAIFYLGHARQALGAAIAIHGDGGAAWLLRRALAQVTREIDDEVSALQSMRRAAA